MNKEKHVYQPVELKLIEFDSSDVIATSGFVTDPDDTSWV